MKKIVVIIIISFLFQNSFSQNNKWDSTYRPANYALKLEQFKSYSNSKRDIVFLGNSIMDYTEWNELLQLKHARNRGISGDISFGIIERLNEVTEGKPAKIFILIGINDISRNIPDSIIIHNYRRIISSIKTSSPRTKIYFHTLLPVNNSFTDRNHFNKDAHILFVNEALKKLAAKEKITLIDIYSPFLGEDKKLIKQYTYDGLHLNTAGYIKWAGILKNYL